MFCRDEVVLSGEGRLEPGVYKFAFEMEFRKVVEGGNMPTSIDVSIRQNGRVIMLTGVV